ncbi:MAG: hemolysin family protein [Gemmobacter sp.]|nr:hemolysin family protein [Gemmobacter sp.]
MGSTNEGSAAEQAAEDPEPSGRRGLFGRLRTVFRAPVTETPVVNGTPAKGAVPVLALPGLSNLRKLRVYDVAVPKAEIVAVPVDIAREELIEVFREQGFSRLPVYKGSLDKPQGLVMLKDFALSTGFGGGPTKFNLRKLIRPVLYAPPSMPLAVLLQKMQTERVHMALVIDEYGGVEGLLTIEDLIETVVGDISDEHDTEEGALWVEEKPGVYLAQALTPLEEFETAIGQSLRTGDDDSEIDTLGGLVFLRIGRVPARGEVIPHESGAEFEVVDADPRRIKRLRVRMPGAARASAPVVAPRVETPGPAPAETALS